MQRNPARNFKDSLSSFIRSNSIYWIATQPKLQLEVLKELIGQNVDVLLDKPIVSDLEELNEFKELAFLAKSTINVAQPWRHSDLWRAHKIAASDIQQILIHRTFIEERNYISPTLDWLPHDFSLLIDLGVHSLDLKYKSLSFDEQKSFKLIAQFSREATLSIDITRSLEKSSVWKILLKNGNTRIVNFKDGTSSMIDSYGKTLEHWTQPANNHPIASVIGSFRGLGNSDLFRHVNYYESYFRHGGK